MNSEALSVKFIDYAALIIHACDKHTVRNVSSAKWSTLCYIYID